MIIIRAIIFAVALAFGFILSGSLDGIGKIRDGASDLAASVLGSFQSQELTANTDGGISGDIEIGKDINITGDLTNNTTNDIRIPEVSRYATPTTAKYLVIAIGLICGIFTATMIGAGVIGLVGGVLFSPEIASVPFLADAAVSVSSAVSALWADLIAKIVESST